MRANGHLTLNGKKMSKSLGNFLTLRDEIRKFGADATRLSLSDAGDGLEDANFEEKTANANILRIHTLLGWCEDMVNDESNLRHGPRTYHDDVFEHEINDLINTMPSHYEAARDWYREMASDIGMHVDLVRYWMRTAALLVTPVAPHFAEHIYSTILKSPTTIQNALWPTPEKPMDETILEAASYMRGTVKTIRDVETALLKMLQKAKGKKGQNAQQMARSTRRSRRP
ncbi:hypothetical protein DXG03_005448 [Asterophora parasitica]|uniref:Uncharacterized protein n=2 Tax=Asterophora parasitica TaxID=117018 RepID=A0A9P7FNG8_9AGAR|nr:hypothetical protein DXG03_005448 [Asterophora parasitica]